MYRSRLAFALAMAALAAILVPSTLPAQITFQRSYGGTINDYGRSVEQTSDGGYIITGCTESFGAGHEDVYLIKTDAYGDTSWTRTFGGDSNDLGLAVQQTADSGYIIAGYTTSFGAGSDDVYLIKTDAAGDTLWTRTFGGNGRDHGYSVQQTTDGDYIVAGTTESFGAGSGDVWLIKTDPQGTPRWTRTFGGADYDWGYSATQTPDGGYIIVGATESFGGEHPNYYLIRTDTNGDTVWTRTFGPATEDYGACVQPTDDDGFIVAGTTDSLGAGEYDVYLIKTDANGDTLWTRIYAAEGENDAFSVQQTTAGGYVIAGQTWTPDSSYVDVLLMKTDANGDTLWTKTFGGTDWDEGYSVQQTTDGGYVVAGQTRSFGAGGDDVYLIKTDSLGALAVAESKASPTRVPGLSLTCEPNPFRKMTAISLQLTADSPAALAIFDASGRCVRTFTVNRAPCTVWDGKDELGQPLPSGAYFARLDAAGQHASTRIVLQR